MKLSDKLEEMESQLQRQIEEAEAAKESTKQVVFEVNPNSQLDEKKFQQALTQYADRLKDQNKMNLVSILQKGKSSFIHNEWTFVVENDIEQGWIIREKELLPYLRSQTSCADLYLKCMVDASYVNERDQIPYSPEDKLKAMGEKNPNLVDLQRIFKTRIVY